MSQSTPSPSLHAIYCFRHTESGRTYIGQSIHPKKRHGEHINALKRGNHQNIRLQRSWNLATPETFEWFVIGEYDSTESCDDAERFYVAWFQQINLSYNFRLGGYEGSSHSAETRQKMSDALKGRIITPETRAKIAATLRGRPGTTKGMKHSEETRRKNSEARLGKPILKLRGQKRTDESREKMRQAKLGKPSWNKGIPMREETKAKLAHTFIPPGHEPWNKGATGIHTQEQLSHNREWHTGRKASEETKRKMSESNRLAWQRRRQT